MEHNFPCVVSTENWSEGTSEKVVLFLRTEYSKRKFVFHFLKATFDTSIRLLWSSFGQWNRFVHNLNVILGIKFTSSEISLQFTQT